MCAGGAATQLRELIAAQAGEEGVSRGTMKEEVGVVLLSSTTNEVCIPSGKAVFFSPILVDCLPAGSLLNQIPDGM